MSYYNLQAVGDATLNAVQATLAITKQIVTDDDYKFIVRQLVPEQSADDDGK